MNFPPRLLTDEHDGNAPVPLLPVALLLRGEGERGGRGQHLPEEEGRRGQHDRRRDDEHAHRVGDHNVVPERKQKLGESAGFILLIDDSEFAFLAWCIVVMSTTLCLRKCYEQLRVTESGRASCSRNLSKAHLKHRVCNVGCNED